MYCNKCSNILGNCLYFILILLLSCGQKVEKTKQIEEVVNDSIPPPPGQIDTTKILKTNTLKDYLLTANIIQPNPGNGRPFSTLKYDKLIAYDFEGCEEPYPAVINEKGDYVPVILSQKSLSQPQADFILSALSETSSYGKGTAACFEPKLALVFYKTDKFVAQINICLDCNYLISSIRIPAETYHKVNEGTKEEFPLPGFSKKGREAIIQLAKELNFRYGAKSTEF